MAERGIHLRQISGNASPDIQNIDSGTSLTLKGILRSQKAIAFLSLVFPSSYHATVPLVTVSNLFFLRRGAVEMIKSHRDRRLLQCTAHADTVHGHSTGVQFTGHYDFTSRSDLSETNQGESLLRLIDYLTRRLRFIFRT